MRARQTRAVLGIAAAALLAAGGCRRDSTPSPAQQPATATATQPAPGEVAALTDFLNEGRPRRGEGPDGSPMSGLPPGHPPIAPPAHGTPADAGTTLKFEAPQEWRPQRTSSSFRKAQYVLPGAGGAGDGELVVFYFGPGEGGPVEANVARWRGMFTTEGGGPVADEAVLRETREVNGLRVTVVDISGRYAPASMMPGTPPVEPQDNYRMLAAIVETAEGPWFFRALGPRETIAAQRDRFLEMLSSVRY